MSINPGEVFVGDLEFVMRTVADRWVVIQFGADWSGTCHAMKQPFVDLARQHTEVVFVHCDVERLHKIAAKHAATRIPCYHFFWNNTLEADFAGASERKLRDTLQDCIDLGPLPKLLISKDGVEEEGLGEMGMEKYALDIGFRSTLSP
eukprot:CAMPEP_0169089698 /NCGR_PEP_ID=MMETSP1015-20121227/15423_1 /TAXON_ID=342587 /ORGANISM="Karlodinium micrum, Strain CCMP2283" /LENGTH=147 /DNA_ID=CAMNT_0009150051 /DNA_START=60 /DNA_END=503 /DNA_ORIENTATION=+